DEAVAQVRCDLAIKIVLKASYTKAVRVTSTRNHKTCVETKSASVILDAQCTNMYDKAVTDSRVPTDCSAFVGGSPRTDVRRRSHIQFGTILGLRVDNT